MKPIALALMAVLLMGGMEALADEQSTHADTVRVTVKLMEYRFEPAEIRLKSGQEVELTLLNTGTILHEFITDALQNLTVEVEVNGVIAETLGIAELEVPAKTTVLLRFTPEKPGEFPIACRAKEPRDHFKEGMAGKLVIR